MRIVFRFVEFSGGYEHTNKLVSVEAYLLGLEAAPMLLATIILAVMHPGIVLRGPESEFPKLSRAEKKQRKQERKAEKKKIRDARAEEKGEGARFGRFDDLLES